MSGGVDEHGRLISDDGWYVWDGTQWLLRQAPAVQHQPAAPAPGGIDLAAEVDTYPLMSRSLRGALLDLARWLHPGEPVLATVPGASWAAGMSGGAALAAVYGATPGVIVAATDRRLLVCGYAGMGSSIHTVLAVAYGDVVQWKPAKKGFTAVANGLPGPIEVHQAAKAKMPGFRAVVEPRLAPGVVQA